MSLFEIPPFYRGGLSRRVLLKTLGLGAPLALNGDDGPKKPGQPTVSSNSVALSKEDDDLLEAVESAGFLFFWEQANPQTGLVRDRCNPTQPPDKQGVASLAATGFGLSALCIGHKRGYAPQSSILQRTIATLQFLWQKMPTHRGFFFHWANNSTGERTWESEISSIDTAILLCGVLTCREYFNHPGVTSLANAIFNRVDWTWVAEDTSLLSHGWTPEVGFLPYRWDNYSELMMLYLLGLGSATYPLPDGSWSAWKRTTFEYDGMRYIGSYAPLFVHQYPQAWFDFRGKRDRFTDYFKNSAIGTEVHRRFCLELHGRFPTYTDDLWGITASDSRHGYAVWGGPPEIGPIDGTVVPSATGGSLPFMPEATLRVLKTIKNRYSPRTWTRYGFINAFNPLTNWYDTDVIGIDTGITMLMAENLRTGFIWNQFMKSKEAQRGFSRAGFKEY